MSHSRMSLPVIAIDIKNYRIRIHKNTLHSIGNPKYILLLVNPEEHTIAIICSDRSDPKAHRVNKASELYSKSLVSSLLDVCKDWQENKLYHIFGEIIHDKGAVKFNMDESVLVNGDK